MDDTVKFVDPGRTNYELSMKICVRATGKKSKLNSEDINPMLEKFKMNLEGFKIDEKQLLITVDSVDDFWFEERLEEGRILFSWWLKFSIRDGRADAVEHFNNSIRPMLTKIIRSMGLKENGINLKVINTRFPEEVAKMASILRSSTPDFQKKWLREIGQRKDFDGHQSLQNMWLRSSARRGLLLAPFQQPEGSICKEKVAKKCWEVAR